MIDKPPLGVAPAYICAEQRIAELSEAIVRCLDDKHYGIIKIWAKEIYLQADLLLQMGREDKEDEQG